ncbi:MAG: metallophosphoesterase [Verrucomicrobiae bacterium]|nr:metallophosphoesterase [Verrucomicrobiae bacterium]
MLLPVKRRRFLQSLPATAAGLPLVASSVAWADEIASAPKLQTVRGGFALDENRARFFSKAVKSPFKVMVIADTHLFRDDERGELFRPYSARMARAYNQTRHFKTGEPTNPEAGLVEALRLAKEAKVELVALVGDMVSFPSEAAVEWLAERLTEAALPYLYVAGNHDWHYEGMEGALENLRWTWIEKRLRPLYQGQNPLMAVREVNGVRFVALDDSHYEILPEQLEFYRAQVRSGQPLVLLVHIPLYAPGRSVGYGCGHPQWGAATDRNFELERRPRWPPAGHTEVTMTFHREVFSTPNLLGVCAGHIHRSSLDVLDGIPQIVTDANATAAYLLAEFLPAVG